ncbi:developmentally-regulated protein [Acrasis kona]|uniref:Developmentally-regulated protein n=1 Tax=Acrasis kona TaxID=1008807 RepID=A0AAW2Z0W8_9EUKA
MNNTHDSTDPTWRMRRAALVMNRMCQSSIIDESVQSNVIHALMKNYGSKQMNMDIEDVVVVLSRMLDEVDEIEEQIYEQFERNKKLNEEYDTLTEELNANQREYTPSMYSRVDKNQLSNRRMIPSRLPDPCDDISCSKILLMNRSRISCLNEEPIRTLKGASPMSVQYGSLSEVPQRTRSQSQPLKHIAKPEPYQC